LNCLPPNDPKFGVHDVENLTYTILLVEDEENDALLLKRAFKKNNLSNPIQWVKDGLDAIAYLKGEGDYADRSRYPFPEVVLLDLKMPRMNGVELLAWIREHPDIQVIPTIVMTSSREDVDVANAYNLGANTYMIKPSDFDTLVKMVKNTHEYWAMSVKPKAKWSNPS
jgi:CheY-like chemotaxis protein